MALGFLGKKTFHPKRGDNVKRVYEAERRVMAEKAKMDDLRKALFMTY